MNEIDVSKCAFYNNGKCDNPNGMACNCCNNVVCYYKQLQQAIKDRDYNKQIVDGCKLENGNCSFCEIDKQLQHLKAENDNLKQEVNRHLKQQEVKDNYLIPKLKKYKQSLDEIERYCKVCRQARTLNIETILQLIKQAKEGN